MREFITRNDVIKMMYVLGQLKPDLTNADGNQIRELVEQVYTQVNELSNKGTVDYDISLIHIEEQTSIGKHLTVTKIEGKGADIIAGLCLAYTHSEGFKDVVVQSLRLYDLYNTMKGGE